MTKTLSNDIGALRTGIENGAAKLIELLAIRAAYADAEEYQEIRKLMSCLRQLTSIGK